ncbi:unnamed protein product [Timema podura]|uniref:Uncharacterized protein n=1 Tax=Timema podura TaxID=61482 RepID=A0ABN7NNC9_TIMPD|nr:unnamed protein product [Timema podura]
MAVALLEFCYKSHTEASRAKIPLSDAMKAKARLTIGGGRDFDNGRVTIPQGVAHDKLWYKTYYKLVKALGPDECRSKAYFVGCFTRSGGSLESTNSSPPASTICSYYTPANQINTADGDPVHSNTHTQV